MANMKLHASLGSHRTAKLLATARIGRVALELQLPDSSFLKSKAFLEKSPLKKLPLLETSTGDLWESNAIVRYLARQGQSTLYTGPPHILGEIDMWLDVCQWDLEVALATWLNPLFGETDYSEEVQRACEDEVRQVMFFLESRLKGRRFLVGDCLTLADVAVCTALSPAYRLVFDEKFRKPFVHANKWFAMIAEELVPELGRFTLCVQALTAGKSKKDKKDKKDKKKKKKGSSDDEAEKPKKDKKKKKKDSSDDEAEKPKKDKKKKKKKDEEHSDEETKEGEDKPKKEKKDKKKKKDEESDQEETKEEKPKKDKKKKKKESDDEAEGEEKPKKDKKKKKDEGEEETKEEKPKKDKKKKKKESGDEAEGEDKPKKDKKKKKKDSDEDEPAEGDTEGKPKKEKKSKDKKKKKEESEETKKEEVPEKPKKAKQVDAGDEDEAPARKVNPLDSLPPSTFILDEWKRLFANTKQKREVMSQFWEHYENEGWTLCMLHYQKVEGECEEVYKTNNLLEGFFSRMDHFRRYCFGAMGVYGDEPRLEIKGVMLWRGKGIPQELMEHPSFEYYTQVQVNPADEQMRRKVEDYWSCNNLDTDQVEGMTVRNWRSFL